MELMGVALAAFLAVAPALAPLADTALPAPTGMPGELATLAAAEAPPSTAAQATAENVTGADLDQEDVSLALALNITNTEFDLPGILFGGGKVEVAIAATAHIEFRAVALRRIERALRESTGGGNWSSREVFGVNASRLVVTAEEMRLAGAVVLRSFQQGQAQAAIETIEQSLPGVAVVSSRFAWTNAEPVGPGFVQRTAAPPGPRARDPPLVMDAEFQLEYIDRIALLETLLKGGLSLGGSLLGTSAFELIGVDQVLDAEVPPGWKGALTITVPKGYAIVSATADVEVSSDHRSATLPLDAATGSDGPSTVTFSSRFLVVSALLFVVVVAGFAVRVLAEPATRLLRPPRRRKR